MGNVEKENEYQSSGNQTRKTENPKWKKNETTHLYFSLIPVFEVIPIDCIKFGIQIFYPLIL
jgi:hypothetical protein